MKKLLLLLLLGSPFISLGQVKFNFTADEHDFGVVEEGETLTHSFEFGNAGKDTIQFKEESRDVRPGCSCTASDYTKTPVAPGEKGYIKAGYNTNGRPGPFTKNITVSQKGMPHKILTIKGVVIRKEEERIISPSSAKSKTPAIQLLKKNHHFPNAEKGKDQVVKLEVKNIGKDTLKILSNHSACQCISYKLLSGKELTPSGYILPGKSGVLEVTYRPVAPPGLSDALTKDILTLYTNDPKNRKIEVQLYSELK